MFIKTKQFSVETYQELLCSAKIRDMSLESRWVLASLWIESHIWVVEINRLVLLDKIEVVNQWEPLLLFKKLAKRICTCSEEKYKVRKTTSLPPKDPEDAHQEAMRRCKDNINC